MLKLSLWPTRNNGGHWSPSDAQQETLLSIPQVESVDSFGAGPWTVIVVFQSIEELQQGLPGVERDILAVLDNPSLRMIRRY